jgi:hypothetical protein
VKTKLLLLIGALFGILACKNPMANLSLPATQTTQARQAAPIAVPNGDFENWDSQLRPIGWYTNGCPLCQGAPFDEYQVRKDSQIVYHGNYSAELIYNYYYQAYGRIKFALSTHPNNLQAYVACHLYSPDTVSITIKLYKNKHVVDSGYWQSTTSIANFTQVNIPISTNATLIDSAQILIKGGKTIAPNNINSTTLWVDDLSFFK